MLYSGLTEEQKLAKNLVSEFDRNRAFPGETISKLTWASWDISCPSATAEAASTTLSYVMAVKEISREMDPKN